MKEIHLRRHAEKDSNGIITENGERKARELSQHLPEFAKVISSNSARAVRTADLMSGQAPIEDERAGFYMATREKSDAINALASAEGLTFLEALQQYNDQEVLDGIDSKATDLNQLIAELFDELDIDEKALIVSHDISISPAMQQKGIPLESIQPLEGYIITEDDDIRPTSQS